MALLDNLPSPQSIALDGNTLYFTNVGSFNNDGSLMMIPALINCQPGNCPTKTLLPNTGFSNGNVLARADRVGRWRQSYRRRRQRLLDRLRRW